MTFIPQPIPPAGYPLSTWTPPVVGQTAPAPLILADRFVPTQADPSTWDIGSLLEGDDPTDAALPWSFLIEQRGIDANGQAHGGVANGTNGHHLYTVTKALPGAALQLEDEARRVAQTFVARGDISRVVAVGSIEGGNTAIGAIELSYHNERTRTIRRLGGL